MQGMVMQAPMGFGSPPQRLPFGAPNSDMGAIGNQMAAPQTISAQQPGVSQQPTAVTGAFAQPFYLRPAYRFKNLNQVTFCVLFETAFVHSKMKH